MTVLAGMVLKWNKSVNLIARSSEASIWRRHITDSAQLWAIAGDRAGHWADLGSGGGFPGLVIAALAHATFPAPRITLVDSDTRKCVFLAEAVRAMSLDVVIVNARIEVMAPLSADVVSARALAPLGSLLEITRRHRTTTGIGLFPKGRTVHKEIEDAEVHWRFERRLHRSVTDPDAAIVEVGVMSSV